MLSIRLTADMEHRLDAMARATGRTKSEIAREAILEHVGDFEDVCIAEERLAAIRAGKSKTVPLEDVMKDYGLEA